MAQRRAFYAGLLPWLVFAVADRTGGVGGVGAAGLAALTAGGVVIILQRCAERKLLPSVGGTVFTALTAFAGSHVEPVGAARFDRAAVMAVLAIVLIFCPPSADEAPMRRPGPRPRTALLWPLAMAVVAVSMGAGAAFAHPLPATVLNWLVPMAAAITALAFTPGEHSRQTTMRTSVSLGGLIDHGRPRRVSVLVDDQPDTA